MRVLLLAQLLDLRPNGLESARGVVARCGQPLLLRDQRLEPLLDVREAQCLPLVEILLLFFVEPLALRRELLETRVLDLDRPLGGGELLADPLPFRASLLHGLLRALETLLRAALNGVCLLEARPELAEHTLELFELDPVARDVSVDLGHLLVGALQVLVLTLNEVLTVLQRLLEAGDFGAHFVIAALHDAEALVAIGELHAQLLDRGFGRTLRGDGGFESDLLLAQRVLVVGDFACAARSGATREALR